MTRTPHFKPAFAWPSRSALAALCWVAATAAPGLAQANTVAASYTFNASPFDDGGGLTGTLSGTLAQWLAAPAPFAAGSSLMGLAGLTGFSAAFSGNNLLPDANFDLSEVLSLTLVDNGTFGAGGGLPGTVPALLVLHAYDDDSDSDLFLRFAGIPGVDGLLGGDAGAAVEFRGDDISARFAPDLVVRLAGGGVLPIPLPSTLALAALALLLLGLRQRRGTPPPPAWREPEALP